MTSFSDFSLREELMRAITDLGFETPTPIQQKVIPQLLSEPIDIIGLAQTGTGKTAAFGLPLLQHADVNLRHVQALILSPTRELCMQIQAEILKYGVHIKGLHIASVYGGVPIGGQIRDLKSNPQIVVATPGRLIDLLERRAISLDEVEFVVLDEADEMLNMGFREDIELILKSTPAREHTWLFSATMSNEVRGIAKRFMKQWKEYAVAAENVTNENIDHQYFVTNNHNRFDTLKRLLDFTPGIYGIIFTRTRQDAQDICEKLMKMGYHVSPLHGDMDQKARTKVMERFKSRNLQAIVATDVAARGIDVSDITHVINYELPDDPEVYTHRSGRTARAGKSGICMSIVTPKEISEIRNIERLVKKRFNKSDIPDGAEVIRKKLFYYLEQIATSDPKLGFAELYEASIQDMFADMEKDELIRRLIWLQLKESIDMYQDAPDLNAGFDGGGRGRSNSARLFINLGTKDGLTQEKLIQFITESVDIEANVIDRVTVKDLSSFFNVPTTAAEYIVDNLAKTKYKGRAVRLEVTEQRQSSGSDDRGPRSFGGGGRGYGGDSRGSYGGGQSRGNSSGGRRFSENARANSFAESSRGGKRGK